MKTIIAGSRNINDYNLVNTAIIKSGFKITEVVCGGARGVDICGKEYAIKNNIPIAYFFPDWDKYNKAAGIIRNRKMAQYADALIAIWDGESKGTKNMIEEAKKLKLKLFIFEC